MASQSHPDLLSIPQSPLARGALQLEMFSDPLAMLLKSTEIIGYTSTMSTDANHDAPVHGLVDSRRAAAILGVSINTFKVWATRSQSATAGVAAAMPRPVATLHGQVYLLADIEEFGRTLALSARAPRTRERGLGSYFTPDAAACLMARWAIRRSTDVVLEPSLGDGQFAFAAHQVATSKGWSRLELHACELDSVAASSAVQSGAVTSDQLHLGDFLAAKDLPSVDAVIGNPPYVRVRELSSDLRHSALRASSDAMGVPMDNAGSVWMPFVAKSTHHLRDRGRLAFVLPLDFTYVRYARPLWNFLGQSYGRLRVVRFRERVFPDILQNVLILLAEEKGRTTEEVEFLAHDRLSDLSDGKIGSGVPIALESIVRGERAFQHALLPTATRDTLALLDEHVGRSHARVKFNIGYVSGNKHFFHPDSHAIKQFKLPSRSLTPTLASSRQLSRQALRTSSMPSTAFLWLPANRLSKGEQDYVTYGEREGVDMAYKCRIRKPWHEVPGVKVPDLLLTTFSDSPRLHINDAGWVASNSVLAGFLRPGQDSESVISSWYTPLTLLSTEMQVHSLGGGVMIAVPREADSVQLINKNCTLPLAPTKLDAALRSGDSTAAYSVGSRSVQELVGKEGLHAIWNGVEALSSWRKSQTA